MDFAAGLWLTIFLVLADGANPGPPGAHSSTHPPPASSAQETGPRRDVHRHVRAPAGQVDVNRPRTPFDCDLPIGEAWYGSQERCLAELCAGENVYNQYIFDASERRRKNPCYGQNPTEFPGTD